MNEEIDIRIMQKKLDDLEKGVHHSSLLIEQNNKDTAEMLEMFKTLKSGIRVLGWIGGAAKWIGSFVAVFAAIYAVVQNLRGVK